MKSRKSLVLAALVVFVLGGLDQCFGQGPSCTVSVYDWGPADFGSSPRPVGEFPMKFSDGIDASITKTYFHSQSGSDISVKASRIGSGFAGIPDKLRIGISFSKTIDVFQDIEGSDAQTSYDKHWNWLRISKSRKVGDRIYVFQFGCSKYNTADGPRKISSKSKG